eukprot:gnl/TRDRNA2_/TRDRNA2_184028_c0_seq1.p1 gnl/TRDRNA2_/TRDRNA2_184028_c0~~gnl/TRDRNA2_/TRDRNA2_184028_c0_seq1.p1  ORF type:complete len:385 (-),score=65.35 gnl/TRDRNA2_/TRDRNA2_184028_c0_seq1:336-1490(-)
MMPRLALSILLASLAHAQTEEHAAGNVLDDLLGRVVTVGSDHYLDLDNTVFGKSSQLTMPSSRRAVFSAAPSHSRPQSRLIPLFPLGGRFQSVGSVMVRALSDHKTAAQLLVSGGRRSHVAHAAGGGQGVAASTEKVETFATEAELAAALVDKVVTASQEAIEDKGHFALAISNSGSIGSALAGLVARASECNFNKWIVMWVNENLKEHPNEKRNQASWMDAVSFNPDRTVQVGDSDFFEAEGMEPAMEASHYDDVLRVLMRSKNIYGTEDAEGRLVPQIDLVLLGTADDGHVGSMTPGSALLADDSGALVLPIDEPSKKMVQLSMLAINAARHIVVYASGAGKAAAIAKGHAKDKSVPLGLINAIEGDVTWLLDTNASAELKK